MLGVYGKCLIRRKALNVMALNNVKACALRIKHEDRLRAPARTAMSAESMHRSLICAEDGASAIEHRRHRDAQQQRATAGWPACANIVMQPGCF